MGSKMIPRSCKFIGLLRLHKEKGFYPPQNPNKFHQKKMILIGFNMRCTTDQSDYGGTCIICPPDVGQAVPKLKRYVPPLSLPSVLHTHTHIHTQFYFCTFILRRSFQWQYRFLFHKWNTHILPLTERRDPQTHVVTTSWFKVQGFRSRYDSLSSNLWINY